MTSSIFLNAPQSLPPALRTCRRPARRRWNSLRAGGLALILGGLVGLVGSVPSVTAADSPVPAPAQVQGAAPATAPSAVEAPAKLPSWMNTLAAADGRLVGQVRPLDGGVGLISRLRPKRFLLHTGQLDSQGRVVLDADPLLTVGLVAQEALSAVPEAVYRPADEAREFWLLDYTKLVPVLVRAVQEQQSDLQSQASRIQALEGQVSGLEAEVARLKEISRIIDDATRAAVAQLSADLSTLKTRVAATEGHTSCSCSK